MTSLGIKKESKAPIIADAIGSGNNVQPRADVSTKLADNGTITMVEDNAIRAEVMCTREIFNQTN